MGTWDGGLFVFSRRIGQTWAETAGGAVSRVGAAALEASR